jgi:membrane protein
MPMAERSPDVDGQVREEQAPDQPTKLPRRAWRGVFRRTLKEYKADNLPDLAAALTYYGVLAIFPMLIVLVSILGLIGHSVTQPLIDNLGKVAPGAAKQIFTSAIQNIQSNKGTAGVLVIPIWKTIPVRLGVTIATLLLLTAGAIAVTFTGGLARQAGNVIGVGSSAVTIWDIAKWPVLILLVAVMLAILYYAAPNVRQPGFRWVTPGGVLAVLVWILVSALFALYVASFSSYNKTYGALASVIVFLVWLWITNTVILLGAELNAEIERGRQIEGGLPADREPFLPPRSEPKRA